MDSSETQDSKSGPRQVSWEEVADMPQFVGGLCEFRDGTAQFRANISQIDIIDGHVYIDMLNGEFMDDDGKWVGRKHDGIDFKVELCETATLVDGNIEFDQPMLGKYKIMPATLPRRIIVTKRSDDFHAEAEGTSCWGCGKVPTLAIGDLVMSHPELFGVVIEMGEGTFKEMNTETPSEGSTDKVH